MDKPPVPNAKLWAGIAAVVATAGVVALAMRRNAAAAPAAGTPGAGTTTPPAGGAVTSTPPPGTAAGVPGAPTNVQAVATASQGATITWTPPANVGASPILGYTITSSPGNLTMTASADPTARAPVMMGLTNGTAYTFTVAAFNASGTGPASAPSNAATPKGFSLTPPPGYLATWKPMPVPTSGVVFGPGLRFRFSIPTNYDVSFQDFAQKLLGIGFLMNQAYDVGAALPADWMSDDQDAGRWRYDVRMDTNHAAYTMKYPDAQDALSKGVRMYGYF